VPERLMPICSASFLCAAHQIILLFCAMQHSVEFVPHFR
jgi:hypothetical protein